MISAISVSARFLDRWLTMINTRKAIRRPLRFESVDDLLAELDRIETANLAGTIRATGNWTVGQILAHLAAWVEYGWDGYPIKAPPLAIRWVLKWMLPGMLRDGMKVGVKIPGVAAGTTAADPMETSEAIERYRTALGRLARGEPVRYDSPAFGPMSDADRTRLQLRHAELHLGFLSLGGYPNVQR
jgi:hypothetical protein